MTKRKTLGPKSYAANSLRSRALVFCTAFVSAVLCGTAQARVAYSLDGSRMTITASSEYKGKGLVLLWDETDRGENAADWANRTNILLNVSASGSTVTVDLADYGIENGTPCRIATSTSYERLETLYMGDKQCYINTGFKDTEVYGVRFGFYGNTCSEPNNGWGCCIGSKEGTSEARGFVVGMSNLYYDKWFWTYTGKRAEGSERPATSTTSINEIAFTNRVFTLGGAKVFGNLAAGSVGISTTNIFIGKRGGDYPTERYFYGHWSHVSFDDAEGNKILDYVPVRRGSDSKVGFWDYATSKFVTSTGSGNFTADAVKTPAETIESDLEVISEAVVPNRELVCALNGSVLTVNVPQGLVGERLLLLWDDGDKGDDPSDWTYSAVISETASASAVSVRLGKLGVKNGQYIRIAAANCYKELETLQMSGNASSAYIDSGIKDSDVYGVRFGFYSPTLTEEFATIIGTQEDAFIVSVSRKENAEWLICYHKKDAVSRPSVKTDSINEIEFAERKCVLNGVTLSSELAAGPVGESGRNIQIGRGELPSSSGTFFYRRCNGYWSHVSFDDADGNKILDYVPVQRVSSDGTLGKVGFYDRATKTFVTSTGTGDFTAGAVKDDEEVVSYNSVSAATKVTGIPGLIISFR